jgi:hypothetical protein
MEQLNLLDWVPPTPEPDAIPVQEPSPANQRAG